MQRAILGVFSLAMLATWLAIWLLVPTDQTGWQALGGALLRVSIVLGAIWLAMPNFKVLLTQFPAWLLVATFAGLLAIALRPRIALFVGPLLLLMWILGPNWLKL